MQMHLAYFSYVMCECFLLRSDYDLFCIFSLRVFISLFNKNTQQCKVNFLGMQRFQSVVRKLFALVLNLNLVSSGCEPPPPSPPEGDQLRLTMGWRGELL